MSVLRLSPKLIFFLLGLATIMSVEQVAARAPSFEGTGYWSHNVSWQRASNNLDELATIEGALVRKFFVYVALGRELSGERLVVPLNTPSVSFDWSTGSTAWMPNVIQERCDYDSSTLGRLARESTKLPAASQRTEPKAEPSSERYREGFQKLSENRLVIVDGTQGPYFLLTPDGNPGSKKQLLIVQQDAFVDLRLDEICSKD